MVLCPGRDPGGGEFEDGADGAGGAYGEGGVAAGEEEGDHLAGEGEDGEVEQTEGDGRGEGWVVEVVRYRIEREEDGGGRLREVDDPTQGKPVIRVFHRWWSLWIVFGGSLVVVFHRRPLKGRNHSED